LNRPGFPVSALSLLVCTCLLLSGCSSGGVAGQLSQSVDQTLSALKSVALTLQLQGEGKATQAINSSAQADMLKNISQEQTSVTNVTVSNEQESRLRHQTLTAISEAADAVISAQEINDIGVTRSTASSKLKQAIQTLEALQKQLGDH
jgi:hypothetical protein